MTNRWGWTVISRDVVGRRIVAVQQVRFQARPRGPAVIDVLGLVLDNGSIIKPITVETELGEYAHDFVVSKAPTTRYCVKDLGHKGQCLYGSFIYLGHKKCSAESPDRRAK